QGFGRAVPNGRRQPLAQRRVDLVKDGSRRRKGLGERLAHADGLGTLPRKSECCRHRRSPKVAKCASSLGRKTPVMAALSSQAADSTEKEAGFSLPTRPKSV